ncbi:DUF3168 domain-containing protein [Tropicibacter sp. R15_0]|uniref:DUF3168 domain-containing protein n=1 Tax=Tropicibacter sp. R15_0 TaxID=2821101 RepID=UPI001ADC15E1|nr:DUF3168 domain-containing protein [Tropicibacter sp. R15_0]MBO9464411.1 DUF3168 domain-containing protein [Tropicibacter sp. R15_0]
MSYAVSGALQTAVYAALQADMTLETLVGDNIFDALPTGTLPQTYVALGPETATEAGDGTDAGAWHEFVISVVTEIAGFLTAKQAAGAISDVLHEAELTLTRGQLVGMWFRKAKATRETGGLRRIDLTFRARVEDN